MSKGTVSSVEELFKILSGSGSVRHQYRYNSKVSIRRGGLVQERYARGDVNLTGDVTAVTVLQSLDLTHWHLYEVHDEPRTEGDVR